MTTMKITEYYTQYPHGFVKMAEDIKTDKAALEYVKAEQKAQVNPINVPHGYKKVTSETVEV